MPLAEAAYVAGLICLTVSAVGCLYLIVSCVLVLRFPDREARGLARPAPPVSVLIPLCGDEPGLEHRLRAMCEQTYPGTIQVLCGVKDRNDQAAAVVKRLNAKGAGLDLVIDARQSGPNRKMANLENLMRHAKHDVLVFVDSDIAVPPTYVHDGVACLDSAGAVTSLYRGRAVTGLWSRLSAITTNCYFLPGVVTGVRLGLAEPCFGATIVMSREMLQRIGGFHRFANQLQDDYAIGQAVRERGEKVRLTSLGIDHVTSEDSARQFWANQRRAALTIKSIDPAGHAGGLLMYPFPIALLAALLGVGQVAIVLAVVAFSCRLALCRCVRSRFGTQSESFCLLLGTELTTFVVYMTSLFGSQVTWRGERLDVEAKGRLAKTHG